MINQSSVILDEHEIDPEPTKKPLKKVLIERMLTKTQCACGCTQVLTLVLPQQVVWQIYDSNIGPLHVKSSVKATDHQHFGEQPKA